MPVVIHDGNADQFIRPVINGETKSHGLKVRCYKSFPPGYLKSVPVFPSSLLISSQSEQNDRLQDQIANNASLFDLRSAHPDILGSLDQDGYGLCWAFSSTKSAMYMRARMNEPGVILSAWWVAGKVKDWADEGGWGAESTAYIADHGVPSFDKCPSYNSRYDNSDTQANALTHKTIEWYDGTDDRQQNVQIMISAFLLGVAPVLDFNWWSHSVCGCRLVSLNPLTIDIDNSWSNSAGDNGIFRLTGSKAVPDNIVVPMVSSASAA